MPRRYDESPFLRQPPVQVEEKRTEDKRTAVGIPRAQGASVALAVVGIVASGAVLLVSAQPIVFHIAAGVWASATFLWTLSFAQRWEEGPNALHWAGALMSSALVGFIAWCIAEVSVSLVPWQAGVIPAWLAFLSLTFCAVYAALIGMRFTQEEFFASPFIEQALAHILEELAVYWGKRARPAGPRPLWTNHEPPEEPELEAHELPPVAELSELELFLGVVHDKQTLSRDKLRGERMADGERITKPVWERCIAELQEHGFVRKVSGKNRWAPGASAEGALEKFRR